MSQQQSKQPVQLPDGDSAYQHLFNNIHQQVFFNKMAAYGHPVYDERQATMMLQQAGQLRYLEQQEAVKQAQDAGNPYEAAGAFLNDHLGGMGYKQAEYPEEEMAIKAAADDFASDPTIYNCVLALKAAEAEHYLRNQGR